MGLAGRDRCGCGALLLPAIAGLVDLCKLILALFEHAPQIRAQPGGEELRTDEDTDQCPNEAADRHDQNWMRKVATGVRQPARQRPDQDASEQPAGASRHGGRLLGQQGLQGALINEFPPQSRQSREFRNL